MKGIFVLTDTYTKTKALAEKRGRNIEELEE